MGLDPVTSSADVNGDENIDAHDITPELIILRGYDVTPENSSTLN
jgi:hypothetical protein